MLPFKDWIAMTEWHPVRIHVKRVESWNWSCLL